jgi:hypothetical protein
MVLLTVSPSLQPHVGVLGNIRSCRHCAFDTIRALGLMFISAGCVAASAESATQLSTRGNLQIPGLIWQGTDERLTVQELVERIAPILWFSRDEPLLLDGLSIPERLPCDQEPLIGPGRLLHC